jgi:hypothetical protein
MGMERLFAFIVVGATLVATFIAIGNGIILLFKNKNTRK